jgi:hypothetical protein
MRRITGISRFGQNPLTLSTPLTKLLTMGRQLSESSLLFCPMIPLQLGDEPLQFLRVAYYVKRRMGCILRDRFHETGTALPAIPQQPEPEVSSLAGSPHCPPGAADDREVQENNCIRSPKPNFDRVVWSQVAIDDPPMLPDEALL